MPIWMLAQAAVLLKTARPGRKQSMSAREQRIRYYAEWHYQRMKKKVGCRRSSQPHFRLARVRGA